MINMPERRARNELELQNLLLRTVRTEVGYDLGKALIWLIRDRIRVYTDPISGRWPMPRNQTLMSFLKMIRRAEKE